MRLRNLFGIRLIVATWATVGIGCLAAGASARPLDGLWISEGYRRILQVDGDHVRAYELTEVSCLPAWDVHASIEAGGAIDFLQNGCRRTLQACRDANQARLSAESCPADTFWRRMPAMPAGQAKNTPEGNYAVFWNTFAENYPFFALHGVDWNQVDERFRPQVNAATSPQKLFAVFQAMVDGLQDAHVLLEAPALRRGYQGHRPDPWLIDYRQWLGAAAVISKRYLPGLESRCQDRIQFGVTTNGIAYLRLINFGGFVPGDVFQDQAAAMDGALDSFFGDSAHWRGLILDFRVNQGGYGTLDTRLASRLTKERYLAYTIRTKDNFRGSLHFTPAQQAWVEPSPRQGGYYGPMVVLTGPNTVSAGENFLLALMGRRPRVMRIGGATQGVFSEVLMRHLPNGWTFGLPNQVITAPDGRSFDGVGIPPDVVVPVFRPTDVQSGRDPALEKGIDVLEAENRAGRGTVSDTLRPLSR